MHKGGNISDMGTHPKGNGFFESWWGRCIVIPSKRIFVLKNPTKASQNPIHHPILLLAHRGKFIRVH